MVLINSLGLQLANKIIIGLKDNPNKYYRHVNRKKMKFGRPQMDKHGSEKIREVVEPVITLKNIQRRICSYLQSIVLPSCMFGGVKGHNNISNALEHIGNIYFLTIDLKEFFTNISHARVNKTLRDYGFSWEDARLITRLTTLKGSLPQGAPTSPVLANLVFSRTALLLKNFCDERNITFTNFVDDLTFSAPRCFKHLEPQILDILKRNKFLVNNKKVHYRRDSCEITGLIVKNGKLYLEKDMLKNISNPRIKAYANAVKKQYNEFMAIKNKKSA